MHEELPPQGAIVTRIWWWNTPDKYAGPARFTTLEEAKAYNSVSILSVELELREPDGRELTLTGLVPSVDSMGHASPRQDPDVLPEVGAKVVDHIPGRLGRPHQTVFRNADGGNFVFI
jgi:hypothetical protein